MAQISNTSHHNGNGKKPGLYERFVNVNREHPVLMNILYIIMAGVVLVWLLLMFLDSWTHHGDEATVPALKGQSVELAELTLRDEGFGMEVMDSVFESTQNPGTIVEQNPSGGAVVKPGRTVYVTIVAFSPKMVTVPEFMNVSRRQAESMFMGLGLKVNTVTVASEYKDLVLGAKVNGVPIRVGQRIPVTSSVTVEVGGGDLTDDETDPNFVMVDGGMSAEEREEHSQGDADSDDSTINMLLQE
ncbi:MAG: PASTA domain-containing protein [Clostridiales bacterium]|nr:PASTA domain-containing protein [Clostridiales bacterium]